MVVPSNVRFLPTCLLGTVPVPFCVPAHAGWQAVDALQKEEDMGPCCCAFERSHRHSVSLRGILEVLSFPTPTRKPLCCKWLGGVVAPSPPTPPLVLVCVQEFSCRSKELLQKPFKSCRPHQTITVSIGRSVSQKHIYMSPWSPYESMSRALRARC